MKRNGVKYNLQNKIHPTKYAIFVQANNNKTYALSPPLYKVKCPREFSPVLWTA